MTSEAIKVMITIRPGKEVCFDLRPGTVVPVEEDGEKKLPMSYDHVFKPNTDVKAAQEEKFTVIGQPTIDRVMKGQNGTVFAYGQTASGKTHTMVGPGESGTIQCLDPAHETYPQRGLIPRMVKDLFERLNSFGQQLDYKVEMSVFEIYNEKISDLLNDEEKRIRPQGEREHFKLIGLHRVPLSNTEQMLVLMDKALKGRHVASTAMNTRSSRSHTIVQLFVNQVNKVSGKELDSQLNLVDLAGSERIGKTQATGQTAKEGTQINQSLSALNLCISKIVEGARHIPYRDSMLTRCLQNSLGGNSATTMLCAMHPGREHYPESVGTLRFASRAKFIKTKVTTNEKLSAEEWKRKYLEAEAKIDTLTKQLELARGSGGAAAGRSGFSGIGPPGSPGVGGGAAAAVSGKWKAIAAMAVLRNRSGGHADPAGDDGDEPPMAPALLAAQEREAKLSQQLEAELEETQALKEEVAEKDRELAEAKQLNDFWEKEMQKLKSLLDIKDKEVRAMHDDSGEAQKELMADLEAAQEVSELAELALDSEKESRQQAEAQLNQAVDDNDVLRNDLDAERKKNEQYMNTLTDRDQTIEKLTKALTDDLVALMPSMNLSREQQQKLLAFTKDATPDQGDAIQQLAAKLYNSQYQHELLDILMILQMEREENMQTWMERVQRSRERRTVIPPQIVTNATVAADESLRVLGILRAGAFFEEEDEARRLEYIRTWEDLSYQYQELVLDIRKLSDGSHKPEDGPWRALVGSVTTNAEQAKRCYEHAEGDIYRAAELCMQGYGITEAAASMRGPSMRQRPTASAPPL